jgi:selenocysteine-specific elongation factor
MTARHVVVGTAGHIDHGKTSLVKALTGTDTDRLPEEKARGITIDLGFAFLEEPDGLTVEIVDVPGHERFVRNMLAGVGGIDLALLVIAADEGVMPQTREHLAICSLLRIKTGLVALTKTDLVEADWLELVTDDVAGLVRGTFLEGAPIVPVSAKTGEGLAELRSALRTLATAVPPRAADQLPRLPIDRVFTVKGFGTVVTGTLMTGRFSADDRVEVYPRGVQAKIRGLQTHRDEPPGHRARGGDARRRRGTVRRAHRVAAGGRDARAAGGRPASPEVAGPRAISHGDQRDHGARAAPRSGGAGAGRSGLRPVPTGGSADRAAR